MTTTIASIIRARRVPGRTPGPWRVGKSSGAVVADSDIGTHGLTPGDIEYYGGALVCESIATRDNANLIAAAPDLLKAIEDSMEYLESIGFATCEDGCECIIHGLRAAVAKAKGGAA